MPTMVTFRKLAGSGFDRVLWFAASLPMALALFLVVTLAGLQPAHAADDLTCGGKDLLAEMKIKEPARWQAFMDQAKTIRNGQSIFWKIEKPGVPANWLLGTFHVSDPRVTSMPEAARKPFADAKTLIVESDEILDQKAASAKLMAMPNLMMFSGKDTIKDLLTDEEETLLSAEMLKRGIPLMSVVKMKPWLISSMLSLSTCELSRKANGAPFLDMKLAQDAVADSKDVKGLETMAEQLQAMDALPMSFHIKSLVSIARHPDFAIDMMETVTQLYLQGQASLIISVSSELNPDKSDSDAAELAAFEKTLIINRNHHMADRADPILAKGNVFMAVGAAHLYGDEGVVALLQAKGYVATPVMP